MRIMSFMAHMNRLVDDESQFLVSTHLPMLVAFPGADMVLMGDAPWNSRRRMRKDRSPREHYL